MILANRMGRQYTIDLSVRSDISVSFSNAYMKRDRDKIVGVVDSVYVSGLFRLQDGKGKAVTVRTSWFQTDIRVDRFCFHLMIPGFTRPDPH